MQQYRHISQYKMQYTFQTNAIILTRFKILFRPSMTSESQLGDLQYETVARASLPCGGPYSISTKRGTEKNGFMFSECPANCVSNYPR